MTNPTSITCEQFADVLADVLERDADEPTRAAAERHALACAECGSLLADLRELRIDAANLPELAPSGDLWAGIEARIATPIVEIGAAVQTSKRGHRTWVWGSAAAAALMIATAVITHELARRTYQPQAVAGVTPAATSAPQVQQSSSSAADGAALANNATEDAAPSNSAPTGAPSTSATPRAQLVSRANPSAQDTYDSEIARLRAVIRDRRSQLDPNTLAVIEKNMAVIDDAIAQCKAALRRDPASRFLMQSLNSALDTKVELLRTAASLPARTL